MNHSNRKRPYKNNGNPQRDQKFDPTTLPPRWKECPRKGTVIADLFLPFKTPLDEKFDEKLDVSDSFPPGMLLMSSNKIGLWIDLTKTTRFYDRKLVEETGVQYVKLPCEGHKEAPNAEITGLFLKRCDEFVAANPGKRVGVHCTHGFNRTGFLICCYLISRLRVPLVDAVSEFAKCRPPGIYKQPYLETLCQRFQVHILNCPEAAPMPDWDDDDGEESERQDASCEGRKSKFAKREVNKENAVFCEGVEGVDQVTDPIVVKNVREKVQSMCNWKQGGFPGLQPVSLDRENMQQMALDHFRVSWKADGLRYMMLIDGPQENYFLDRDNTVFHAPTFKFPMRKQPECALSDSLLDGELVVDSVNQQKVFRFLAYDIVVFNNEPVGQGDYDLRLLCIDKEIVGPRNAAIERGSIIKSDEPFSIRCKPFYDITKTRKLLTSDKFVREVSHELDGLVFQRYYAPYKGGTNFSVLKWKPPHLNTIDFKMKVVTETKEGCLPEPTILLFVGGCSLPVGYMVKCKEASKLPEGAIVECAPLTFTESNGYRNKEIWKFLRHRTDKSTPNHFRTAQAVFKSILQPVTADILLSFIDSQAKKPSLKRS